MPFKSSKQRAFMYINHPEIAKRWSKEKKGKSYTKEHIKMARRMMK